MSLTRKIVITIIVIFLLIVAILHAYINIKGKEIITNKLESIFKCKVTVGSVKARLPLNVVIKNLEVKGLFKIDKAYALGGAVDIFRKSVILYQLRLDHLVLNIEKPLKGDSIVPAAPEASVNATSASAAPAPVANLSDQSQPAANTDPRIDNSPDSDIFSFRQIQLKRLIVNNGLINFVDKSIKDKEVKITIDKLNVSLDNIEIPMRESNIISFNFKGRIPWQNSKEEGNVELIGWINLFKRDIQAKLKIEGIDGIAIQPYYSGWVNAEKARIQKAKLNFTSNIQGLNNDMSAQCSLKLTEVEFKSRSPEEEQARAEKIAHVVLDMFRSMNQGDIVLNFTIKTKMDSPEFGLGNIRSAFEDKLTSARRGGLNPANMVKVPAKVVEGTVSSVSDITKALISGVFAIGDGVKKAVETGMHSETSEGTGEAGSNDEDVFSRIANKSNSTK